jgi:hypothetical protein
MPNFFVALNIEFDTCKVTIEIIIGTHKLGIATEVYLEKS